MDFKIINSNRCVSLHYIATFLEYKRPNVFINNMKSKSSLIYEENYIRIEEAILLLRKSIRNNIDKLFHILLNDKHNEEVKALKDKVLDLCDGRSTDIYNTELNIFFKNVHTIISSYKIELIDELKCIDMLSNYSIDTIEEGIDILWKIFEDGIPLSKKDIEKNKYF